MVWALTVTYPAGRVGWQGALSWWEPSWEGAGLGLDTDKLASGLGGVKELARGHVCTDKHAHICTGIRGGKCLLWCV